MCDVRRCVVKWIAYDIYSRRRTYAVVGLTGDQSSLLRLKRLHICCATPQLRSTLNDLDPRIFECRGFVPSWNFPAINTLGSADRHAVGYRQTIIGNVMIKLRAVAIIYLEGIKMDKVRQNIPRDLSRSAVKRHVEGMEEFEGIIENKCSDFGSICYSMDSDLSKYCLTFPRQEDSLWQALTRYWWQKVVGV
ncbi:hypothetical protein BDN67DRAFT_976846 [Paxillus ammoniavirescens]|nr:hypothetical protein BDN67DRAFT_976846 [Paxillus ammoniavirescens]